VSLFLPCRGDAEWQPGRVATRRIGTAGAVRQHSAVSLKNHMFPGACFVKMYYFALDFAIEMPYPLAPPQGWEGSLIFENLAASN
jgi:hypothetical protein